MWCNDETEKRITPHATSLLTASRDLRHWINDRLTRHGSLFLVLLLLGLSVGSFGQVPTYGRQFSIVPVGGYTFNELMRSNYGNKLRINVEGSGHYGFIVNYKFVNICSAE